MESINRATQFSTVKSFVKESFHTTESNDNNKDTNQEMTKSFKDTKWDFVDLDSSDLIVEENVPTKVRHKKSLSDSNFEKFFYYANQKYNEMRKEDDSKDVSKNFYSDSCSDTDAKTNIYEKEFNCFLNFDSKIDPRPKDTI